jgi:hypothetical protein
MANLNARRDTLWKNLQDLEANRQVQTLDPDGSKRRDMKAEIDTLDKAIKGIPLLPGLTGDSKVDAKAMKMWDDIIKGLMNPGSLSPEERSQLFYTDPNQAMMDAMMGLGDDSVFFGSTYKKYSSQSQGLGSMFGLPGFGGYGFPSYNPYGIPQPAPDTGQGAPTSFDPLTGVTMMDFWDNFLSPPGKTP